MSTNTVVHATRTGRMAEFVLELDKNLAMAGLDADQRHIVLGALLRTRVGPVAQDTAALDALVLQFEAAARAQTHYQHDLTQFEGGPGAANEQRYLHAATEAAWCIFRTHGAWAQGITARENSEF
jgi:hypothetical protein